MKVEQIRRYITDVPDFPIKGVLFRDITPLLSNGAAFSQAIDALIEGIEFGSIDAIAGIESRGFILAAAIAVRTGKGFVPIRKKNKLPPPVQSHHYVLEYGTDTLEIKPGTGRLLVVDDVLATGGTISAALDLCASAGYQVAELSFLINLKYLNQFSWNNRPARAVVEYS